MSDIMDWIRAHGGAQGPLLASAFALALAIALALAVHRIGLGVLRRAARRTTNDADDTILRHGARPLKWILVIIAASLAQRAAPLDEWAASMWRQVVGFVLPAMFGWLTIELIRAAKEIIERRADISQADNLQARRRRTRVSILTRIATVLVLFLTACMMLISIPGVRSVGVTLMASAGLVGLAVGAAAQPALKNLIAGVQLAFSEPIRIDDVVIIAGEWGRIEDIRLTYVVVRVWDERRLVVPVAKFLEEPFQNWTRESSQLLGSAMIYVDPGADVARIRRKLEEIVRANALWDGRFFNLQVTDVREEVMELRALMTAADAGRTFDLRCDVREALMRFIADEAPEALPRRRLAPGAERRDAEARKPEPAAAP
jgi:small-conductance mechanosensitive channel